MPSWKKSYLLIEVASSSARRVRHTRKKLGYSRDLTKSALLSFSSHFGLSLTLDMTQPTCIMRQGRSRCKAVHRVHSLLLQTMLAIYCDADTSCLNSKFSSKQPSTAALIPSWVDNISFLQISAHTEKDCPLTIISCPYFDHMGCEAKVILRETCKR